MGGPEIRIVAHFALSVAEDLIDIVADESARVIAGRFCGVDDGRANGEHVLEALVHGVLFRLDPLKVRRRQFRPRS